MSEHIDFWELVVCPRTGQTIGLRLNGRTIPCNSIQLTALPDNVTNLKLEIPIIPGACVFVVSNRDESLIHTPRPLPIQEDTVETTEQASPSRRLEL